jgi:hypothetical protein
VARLNEKKTGTKTVNVAGGVGYSLSPKMELVLGVINSFVKSKFYKSVDTETERLLDLARNADPEFVAKTAVVARDMFGMRTITHLLAPVVWEKASGYPWLSRFYDKVVVRPDDMLEIASAHISMHGKPLPHAMRKGFAKAFERFDAYAIAKYKNSDKKISLVDIVNLVHPKPTAKNAEALKALVAGTLKNVDTWESKVSGAGPESGAKSAAWEEMITEGKMGYMALLRNCHNIARDVPDDKVFDEFLKQLASGSRIKKARVMPFRVVKAVSEMDKWDDVEPSRKKRMYQALVKAMDKACENINRLDGRNLVILDESGSMSRVFDNACLMTAVIEKTQNADVLKFNNIARWWVPKHSSVLENADDLDRSFSGGGTSFESAYMAIREKKYDRIFVISDMQTWADAPSFSPKTQYHDYVKRHGPTKLYMFDVTGYGTLLNPEEDVYILGGYTLNVFDILEPLEMDKQALIKTIEAVKL